MNKFIVLLASLIFISVQLHADDSEYLENVRLDPEHGALNHDGEVKVMFNLPKDDLVKKVYLSYTSSAGISELIFSSTEITGSELGYLNNALTLKGSELYEILESSKTGGIFRNRTVFADDETNDEDTFEEETDDEMNDDDTVFENQYSWADKAYDIKLTVELDNSGNNEDDEKDDSDTTTTTTGTIPEKVTKTVKIIFDNVPPGPPESIETEGGDGRIIIRVSPPKINDVPEKTGRYHAVLSGLFKNSDGSEVKGELEYSSKVDPGEYTKTWEFSVSGKDGLKLINNDENKSEHVYIISVRAEDIAGNSDPDAVLTVQGSAVTTFGYWNHYKEKGGRDDGGFCFIATAGFGSYFHPQVKILRNFRDLVLTKFSFGRVFIQTYYKYGKLPADLISQSPALKAAVRTLLVPFVVTGWLFTSFTGWLILILWGIVFSLFFVNRKAFSFFAAVFMAVLFLNPAELKGVDGEFSFTNSFYYPSKIDDQSEGKPFKEVGGDDIRYLPSLTFGFKMPVLENYIRWSFVGGIGFTRFKGTSIKADGSKSEDETAMYFIPLMGEMKLRPGYDFPVWPYATIGIDYYIWWIREKGKTAEEGGTFGFHGSFGLMFSLNWMDDSSANKFEEATGITNTALFVHYRLEKINDFGKKKSFDLSGSRFEFGIVFEF